MRLAIKILVFILACICSLGFIGEKNIKEKLLYLLGAIVFIILLFQNIGV